jgi:hypothetical protein
MEHVGPIINMSTTDTIKDNREYMIGQEDMA